jgi:hypothetical protein
MSADSEITIELASDTIRILGVRYDLGMFRALAFGTIGTVFRLIRRDDETITLRQIKLPGPVE